MANIIFYKPEHLQLFLYLVLRANHQKGRCYGVEINRGQLLTGRKSLSSELRTSEGTIYKRLLWLQRNKLISIKSNNKYTIVTICNYDTYNSVLTTTGQQGNNKVTTTGQQGNTNKNVKNVENEKNEKNKDTVVFVVETLNKLSGKNYKYDNKKTIQFISARIKEGYTRDDFQKVIELKCKDWLNTDMNKFLRPETLFGNKFESYLNTAPKKNLYNPNRSVMDDNYRNRSVLND